MAKKVYSVKLKREILDKIRSGARAVDLAPNYGIDAGQIYKWVSKDADINPGSVHLGKLARENRALKEIVAELTVEVKRFKKNKYGK